MRKGVFKLRLYNSDEHSFNDVVNMLVEATGLNLHQAIQCASLIHYNDSYVVKSGTRKELEFYKWMFGQAKLRCEIEK